MEQVHHSREDHLSLRSTPGQRTDEERSSALRSCDLTGHGAGGTGMSGRLCDALAFHQAPSHNASLSWVNTGGVTAPRRA